MKRTPPIKMNQAQIGSALRKLKLKKGRSRRTACRVVVAWLKMRVEPEIPEREKLTDRQLRAILRNIKRTLNRATDTLLRAPKNARHEMAIEYQGIRRLTNRMALSYPAKGMRKLVQVAE